MNDKASELQSRACAAKAAAIAALRELFKLKGSEASEEATMLEMLSDAVVTNAIGSGDISKEDLLNVSPFDAYDIIGLFGDSVGAINDVVTTLENVIEVPVGFFDYSDEATRVTVGNGE